MVAYLDCNASTPIDFRVAQAVCEWQEQIPGNANALSHKHGEEAAVVVEDARNTLATSVACEPHEVLFTSGATESNNLALLGLIDYGLRTGKRHLISTGIEHQSVLEPLKHMETRGFELETAPVDPSGRIDPRRLLEKVRSDTLLVSVMLVNNVTGVQQPVEEVAEGLSHTDVFFHVDAAQGFGRLIEPLRNSRVQLISISGHKIYGPKGIGALVIRDELPLSPLFFGGAQQGGLRPGTLPVPLIGGLGKATELAMAEQVARDARNMQFGRRLWRALAPLKPMRLGAQAYASPHVLCVAFPDVDAEMAVHGLKQHLSVSRGAACASRATGPSHVLLAMGLDASVLDGALRFSWYHETPELDWAQIQSSLQLLHNF